jgi:hypothetical protein
MSNNRVIYYFDITINNFVTIKKLVETHVNVSTSIKILIITIIVKVNNKIL